MFYNNNDYICNLYDDFLGESFPNFFIQFENPNNNENLNEINDKNINYENNNDNNENKKSFKIRIKIEEPTVPSTDDKNQKKEIEIKTENNKENSNIKKFKITSENLKKKRGRTNNGKTQTEHNKFSDDNVRRKCKHLVIKNLMNFINKKIDELYINKGYGMNIKKLLIINQSQKSNATIKFNSVFLNKTLSEIFSVDISTRYTNFRKEHNKILISKLINDNDEYKKNYFTKIFNLTFVECLRHFNGSIFIPELNGMTLFSQLYLESDNDEGYYDVLSHYINNYEEIMERKRRKKEGIV
jgi:hypothetical protein